MTEVYALIQGAFIETSELVHVLPKRGMALLLEAMATGSIVVQDTKHLTFCKKQKHIRESVRRLKQNVCIRFANRKVKKPNVTKLETFGIL